MKTTGILALAAAVILAMAGCEAGGKAAGGRLALGAQGRSPGVKLSLLAYVDRADSAEAENWDYEVGIFQIQNGRHVLLYPRDRATGKILPPKP